jgi:hypothetical protein
MRQFFDSTISIITTRSYRDTVMNELHSPRRPPIVILTLVAAIATSAVAIYVTIQRYPRIEIAAVTDFVPEQRVKTYNYKVVDFVDGKPVYETKTGELSYMVWKPVDRDLQKSITPLEWLQFAVLAIIAAFYNVYVALVLYLWIRDKLARTRSDRHSKEIDLRLTGILTFAVGALSGLIGGTHVSSNFYKEVADHQIESLNERINQYKQQLDDSNTTISHMVSILSEGAIYRDPENKPEPPAPVDGDPEIDAGNSEPPAAPT